MWTNGTTKRMDQKMTKSEMELETQINPDSDEKIKKAFSELLENATGAKRTCFMSIPVREDVDADCIVKRALDDYMRLRRSIKPPTPTERRASIPCNGDEPNQKTKTFRWGDENS